MLLSHIYKYSLAHGVTALLSAALLNAPSAHAQPEPPRVAPTPEWVATLEIPPLNEARRNETKDGVYYLLYDRQMNWRPGRYHRYKRTVVKVIDRSGLEDAASLSVDFNPDFSHIILHSFSIIRDGIEIDKTSSLKFQVLQRETDLERGILDGIFTAHTHATDVRVGDIVDVSYSRISTPRILKQGFSSGFSASWSVPVAIARHRLVWPKDHKISIRQHGTSLEPEIEEHENKTIYSWIIRDPDPVPHQPDVPRWRDIWASVDITSGISWADVVKDELPLYNYDLPLPPVFAVKIDTIKAKYSAPNDRLTEALRLVQDSIRYVGIEIGRGAYQPRPPMSVVNAGFGDCKDKSLLLATALRRLGIDAAVTLAHTRKGKSINEKLPSPYEFNHAIVRAQLNGKVLWLDPTLSHQGGRAPHIAPPDYGYVLPLQEQTADLEEIVIPANGDPTQDVIERYQFLHHSADKFTLTVHSNYSREEADYWREKLASDSLKELQQRYQEFYDGLYPGIRTVRPLQVSDDRDKNIITLVENYAIDKQAYDEAELDSGFRFRASSLNESFETPSLINRTTPIKLLYPLNARHRIIVNDPPIKLREPDDATIRTDQIYARMSGASADDRLEIDWLVQTKAPEIPLKDAEEYRKLVSDFEDNFYWTYKFTSSEGEPPR